MADKVITQKTVTIGEIDRLTIDRSGLSASPPYLNATYRVCDANDKDIGHHRVARVELTAGQVSTLQNFVTNVVLPIVNAVEGTT